MLWKCPLGDPDEGSGDLPLDQHCGVLDTGLTDALSLLVLRRTTGRA